MPIINPSIHDFLIRIKQKKHSSNAQRFYHRYLKVASRNMCRNYSTIDTSIHFKNALKKYLPILTNKLQCQINESDITNPMISNIYEYLCESIEKNNLNCNSYASKEVEGQYFQLSDSNFDTFFFSPNILYSSHHSWIFSDTPIAILVISLDKSHKDKRKKILPLILFEIDLMKAAGFTLVLCGRINIEFDTSFYLHLIHANQFAEVHLTMEDTSFMKHFIQYSLKEYKNLFESINSFLYIYSSYVKKKDESRQFYKTIKKIPRTNILTFAEESKMYIKNALYSTIAPFPYCKNGFKYKHLRIELCNVSVYEFEDDNETFVPTEIQGISLCYISPKDFLSWKNERVKVIIDDRINNRYIEKYVNFEDIHLIRKDFYSIDSFYAGKIKNEYISSVNALEKQISKCINERRGKNFKSDFINKLNKKEIVNNTFKHVIYAYSYTENSLDKDFYIHKPQIYAAIKASNEIFKRYKFNLDNFFKENSYNDNIVRIKMRPIYQKVEDMKSNNASIKNVLTFFQSIYHEYNTDLKSDLHKNCMSKLGLPKGKLDFKFLSAMNFLIKLSESDEKMKNKIINAELEIIKESVANVLNKYHKGYVYQVETGEGKSCIICLIAAILALNGKNVHICSSNIKLANRDYMDSFRFFRQLKLKSAVLAHDNELPIKPKKKVKNIFFINNSDIKNLGTLAENKDSNNNKKIIERKEDVYDFNSIFKGNFEDNIQDDKTDYTYYYHNKDFNYYDEDQFKNQSRMNFSVCGLDCDNRVVNDPPNIVFSTFINFECFYLKMMEICPGYIDEYYDKHALLIDEADSILIDEIANCTIISHDVKSNSKEILKFVYENKNNMTTDVMLAQIKKMWPNCVDLTEADISNMYSEIELVNRDEYSDGKKYSIEEFTVKNDKKKKKMIREALNLAKDISFNVAKGLIKEFASDEQDDEKDDSDDNDDDDSDDDDDEEEDDDIEDGGPTTIFRKIVPFDYQNKGILEPNKEFSGFVQQFIAIKESKMEKNKNIIIKDMSLNYMYVPHPIFVKLYSRVCGFTGTVGNKDDKQIYLEQYKLKTKIIPRNKPNRRIELPIILCNTTIERNKNIVFEILQFHQRGNPVLVIFQDLKEINNVAEILHIKGIHYINIFDGKNDLRPDKIAGLNGAISLGTNFCGRGTNIIAKDKPLHVIISYFTSNSRVMNQARGRTARYGRPGTTRVICVKDQFFKPKLVNCNTMHSLIDEFAVKNKMQTEYIIYFQKIKPWIFNNDIEKQNLKPEYVNIMRKTRINVNRIVAFNFKFPLKMSVKTFLKIQTQRIFSILNCPNSKYSWKLFQKYIREMILEAWSIMLHNFDFEFFKKKENEEYKNRIEKLKNDIFNLSKEEYEMKLTEINTQFSQNIKKYSDELKISKDNLIKEILYYIPNEKIGIVDTFMNIFEKVRNKYEENILSSFNPMGNCYLQNSDCKTISCQIGFRPYSLLKESGARINYKNFKKMNYIKDPELKYLKLTPKNHICLLSITEKIDDLFNMIYQKINEILGNKTFLKFFMRRTLCGCEFGICLNFFMKNEEKNDLNCIIDTDPLLLFTINVKSVIPVLAGILIFLLVYVASMSKKIFEWFASFPKEFTKEVAMRVVGVILNVVAPDLVNFGLDKLINFLTLTLEKQIDQLRLFNTKQACFAADIIEGLKLLFSSKVGEKINQKFSSFVGSKIKVTLNWEKLLKNCFDPERIMKISFLILLCISTYVLVFNSHKNSIKQAENDSEKIEKAFRAKNSNGKKRDKKAVKNAINSLSKEEKKKMMNEGNLLIESIKNNEDNQLEENYYDDIVESDAEKNFHSQEWNEIEDQKKAQIREESIKIAKTFLYIFKSYNPHEKLVRCTDFIVEMISDNDELSNGVAELRKVVLKKERKRKCLRMRYNCGIKKAIIEQVRIYMTNQYPSILQLVGYSTHHKKEDLFVEMKENGTLQNYINKSQKEMNSTEKLIIAYGIAKAMNFLHKHNIVHRNLSPSAIFLDSKLYPYLSEFNYAKQIESKYSYILNYSTPGFMAPEFTHDYKSNQDSFGIDVYAFGMTIFCLVTNKNPFIGIDEKEINQNGEKGIRPEFPKKTDKNWIKLIEKCWSQNPSNRPSFEDICCNLQSSEFVNNSIDIESFQKYQNLFLKY